MPEELKDKVDAQETTDEKRERLDRTYPNYCSDLVQEHSDDLDNT